MTIPDGIFKAYDIRGLYPQELDEAAAERIGCALAQQLGASRLGAGMDPRPSSVGLLEAFAAGAAAGGASTVDFGLVPTEMLYFGVASRGLDGGAMVTASHNPPQYNGMKLVEEGALPLSGDSGIPELKERSQALAELPAKVAGTDSERLDLYPDYVEHLHGWSTSPRSVRTRSSWTRPTASAASWRRSCSRARRSTASRCTSRSTARSPTTSPTRCSRRTAARSASASWPRRPTSASPGTATPTAASSSTRTASSCPATSSPRCSPRRCCSRTPAPRSSTTCAPAAPCRT